MQIDWVTLAVGLIGGVLGAIAKNYTGTAAAAPPGPAPTAAPPAAAPTTQRQGLLARLRGSPAASSTSSTTPAASTPASPTGHPILDGLVQVLESSVATNPQLANLLSGAVVTLLHPGGGPGVIGTQISIGPTTSIAPPSSTPATPPPPLAPATTAQAA
jgi:hypothetical protein